MDVTPLLNRVQAEAQRRLAKAAAFCAKELKVTVSVPAPRKVSKKTGRPYATVPATPGAPPRKLSGRGRAGISWKMADGAAVVGETVRYMPRHEHTGHPWVRPTLARIRPELNRILRGG